MGGAPVPIPSRTAGEPSKHSVKFRTCEVDLRGWLFMAYARDLTEQRFGRWTALFQAPKPNAHRNAQWVCKCACGFFGIVSSDNLVRRRSVSCGCSRKYPLVIDELDETTARYFQLRN